MQRKKTSVPSYLPLRHLTFLSSGNLSVKSLADIVHKEDFVEDSEYLETLVVAIPKYNLSLIHHGSGLASIQKPRKGMDNQV